LGEVSRGSQQLGDALFGRVSFHGLSSGPKGPQGLSWYLDRLLRSSPVSLIEPKTE
jgi:hypothetical protein